jgi:hypothetical protein
MQAVRTFNKGCGRDRRGLAIVTAFGVNRKTSRRTELTNTNAAIHLQPVQYRFPCARLGSGRRRVGRGLQCLCERHLPRVGLVHFVKKRAGQRAKTANRPILPELTDGVRGGGVAHHGLRGGHWGQLSQPIERA